MRTISESELADMLGIGRKKGHWVRPFGATGSSYRYQCSVCGEVAYCVTGTCGRKYKEKNPKCAYKFCPHCGAEMGDKNAAD